MIKSLAVCLVSLLCFIPIPGLCEEENETVHFDEILVKGREEKGVFEVKDRQPDTEGTINREGIKLYGGAGQITPFKAVDILPSVNYQSADAYGLTNNQSIRVRGQSRVASTVEGLSLLNYGLTPGVSDQWLFDMENLSSVSLYRGAAPAEKSLVPYNTGGTVDRIILRPADKIGFTFNESHGTYNFNKIFARFDTGALPTGTKIFASFSHTNADKWKGEGDTRSDIFSFGATQVFSPNVKAEFFATYSNPETNTYRSLTYSQTKQLGTQYRYDYNPSLTGNNKQDIYYYDYNKSTFTNSAYFANIEIKTPGKGILRIKPYYARERGTTLAGVANILKAPGVRLWYIDHSMYGVGSTYETPFLLGTDMTVGYWYCNQEPPGPPTAQKVFRANNNMLTYAGWTMLANPTENHEWHSPYVSLGKQVGGFYIKGGARYVYEKIPSIDLYNSNQVPDVSYDDALDYGNVNTAGSVHGGIIRELLPNFGINYSITKQWNTYFNYGRNIGRPAFDNWTTYGNNANAFANKGLTAQYLWNQTKPEISDNFDLGVRYNSDRLSVGGTLFYGMYNDKGANVLDPYLGIKYTQNIARAISYGAEFETSVSVTKNLNVFAALSYNKFEFTRDITTAANTVTMAKGNQVPDVPLYEAKVGATYRFFTNFAVSPIIRYVGERYGDVENNERVPSYTVVDADVRYTKENFWNFKSISAGISFYNLFNSRYISVINVSDDTAQGSASYYVGAPLTVIGRVEFKF